MLNFLIIKSMWATFQYLNHHRDFKVAENSNKILNK